jgi:hypothetical protein
MTDEAFYSPTAKPAPARIAKPGELLFEFVRASDRARMTCELRFAAIRWAEEERRGDGERQRLMTDR